LKKACVVFGFLGGASLLLTAPHALAQNADLFDLSLEELSNVTINSVALRQQSPRDSAALVTVVTREMLDSYAVGSLAQALALLPGFRILQRTTFNQAYSSVRGVSVNDNDKHLLILIDGVPVRVNSTGGSNRLLYEAFPVSSLERIELIQGQAATIYGSNAVNAVVNLVTRATDEVRAGWRDGAVTGGIGHSFDFSAGNLDVTLNRQRAFSNWDHTGVVIPASLTGDLDSTGDSLLARWRSPDLHGQLLLMDGNSHTISSLFAAAPDSDVNDKTVLARLGSEQRLTQFSDMLWRWDLALDRTEIAYATIQGNSQEFWLNSSLQGELTDQLRWIMGASVMHADGHLNPLLADWSTREHSAFLQLNYDLTDRVELGSGFNWQQLQDADEDLTPQASMVWKADEHWRVKLLFGESFRNADPRERFSNNRSQRGNPDLVAERGMQSTVALNYQHDRGQLQLAFFDQRLSEVISLVLRPDQSRVFENIGSASARGMQLELHWQLGQSWLIDGTHSQIFSAEGLSEPRQLSSLGWRYQPPANWSASLRLDYASAGRYVTTPATTVLNPAAQAGLSWNAALAVKLEPVCSRCPRGSLLQLASTNIANQQRWQVATVTVNTLPVLPDRAWSVSLTMPLSF
jgi:outer membrane receptor for ferrienterochelin and colicins